MMVHVMIEPDYAQVTVGHWCDVCAKPSVTRTPLLAITENGVTRGGAIMACALCGDDESEDGDD